MNDNEATFDPFTDFDFDLAHKTSALMDEVSNSDDLTNSTRKRALIVVENLQRIIQDVRIRSLRKRKALIGAAASDPAED